ncbi:MAG: tRNA dihydrouridine synthase [Planctomycetaceae bacterium]
MGLRELSTRPCPVLSLAPMQDVTDLPFWSVTHRYGAADVYFTEYFRVHKHSTPERFILRSIDENPTGRPVVAQMIGRDIPHLVRTAVELQKHNVIGIDLNMGCPAPVVCNKHAGGGLLRNLEETNDILLALRDAVQCDFTVKTRVGFESEDEFDRLLDLFASHPIDALSIHGRTVKEKYQSPIHYDRIRQAVERMDCPVYANGNVVSVALAQRTLDETGAAGLMIGRGAIRNPWLFAQIRSHFDPTLPDHAGPTLSDLHQYICDLFDAIPKPGVAEKLHVKKMKRYMNYIGQGVDPDNQFLHQIRRAETKAEFFAICDKFLLNDTRLPEEPPATSAVFAGLAG